jgi:hypothetical protein
VIEIAGEVPIIVGEVPIIVGEVPIIVGEVPIIVGEVPIIVGEVPITVGEVPGGGSGEGTVPIISKISPFSFTNTNGGRPSRKPAGTALGIVPPPCNVTQKFTDQNLYTNTIPRFFSW